MIYVTIADPFVSLLDEVELEKTATAIMQHEDQDLDQEFSVVIEADEELQRLNHEFRDIDAPTDVLSFPADEFDPETKKSYIGDIIISYPRALAQAESAGHPVLAEIKLLMLHGILHLLGYDHATPEEKAEMWAVQAQAIQDLQIPILKLPEE